VCVCVYASDMWVEGIARGADKRNTYVSWTDDGAVPVGHEDIVAVLEAIRARSVADALLTLFELLKQAEVAWNWRVFGRVVVH
jgi:hypothetical protein